MKTKIPTARWVARVRQGVESIIESGRIESMASVMDLRANIPTPFEWDINLYQNRKHADEERKVATIIESEDANVDLIDFQDHNEQPEEDSVQPPELLPRRRMS